MQQSVEVSVTKVKGVIATATRDMVAAEEPLEIRLNYNSKLGRVTKSISVTMRTPGNDAELSIGFLFTEGIIKSAEEVREIKNEGKKKEHVIFVALQDHVTPDVAKLERNFYTTSSCGVCGKSSIEAVRIACNIIDTKDDILVSPALLYSLPDILLKSQDVFENTGGIHGCALFNLDGTLLLSREDAGRHNALDKLIGAALNLGLIPLDNHILLLSGRASFELIQKSAMAGIKIIASVGAPSSLAVQLADEWGMTLLGFLRDERFNIYTGVQRINVKNVKM